MRDIDVRALQVKMLAEPQLRQLHALELAEDRALLAPELTARFRLAGMNAHYGVLRSGAKAKRPAPRDLHAWAVKVRAAVDRLVRASGGFYPDGSVEDLHAFDWAVHGADLDLALRRVAAPAAAAPGTARRDDDWTTRSERP